MCNFTSCEKKEQCTYNNRSAIVLDNKKNCSVVMDARTSSWEMFFGNVLDQLSSAALLDLPTLESIAADVDAKVEQLQEWYVNSIFLFDITH